jgi:hypothetical protein
LNELINFYLRFAANDLPDDICWIVVQPLSGVLTVEEAVTRIGGSPNNLRNMNAPDAYDLSSGDAVSLKQEETGISILQIGGFIGLHSEMIEPLSRGTRAWVIDWDVNASFSMLHWVEGSCVGGWDPYGPREDWAAGLGPMDRYADFFLKYDIDDDDCDPYYRKAVALAVIEQESGARLDRERMIQDNPALLVNECPTHGMDFSEFDD